ncbi:helix-turn-helix transcriptional regulator [Hansschlegelia sp. KR7-227]|jgi:DNA-binding XRE family transcriptional regulator|uniref:helix-turn-helix transcriptional regulator n=1 Tax=Hansschlegelia sp. KR7-227 TaxID=3400914 RepID=UPI003BFC6743
MLSGRWCRASRAVLGWTQDDLAARARVSKGTIVAFEKEDRFPTVCTIRQVQQTFEDSGIAYQVVGAVVVGMQIRIRTWA